MIALLDALYKLGKLYIEKENLDEIDVLLDNKKIGAVFLVEFLEDSNGNLSYNKVFQEDYDSQNKVKYLYKKGSSRGTDITPSCLITELDKTFNNKFIKWFENNKDNSEIFHKIYLEIKNNESLIYSQLDELIKSVSIKGANILLSIVINKHDEIKYLNDFSEFKQILLDDSLKKYYGGKKNIKGTGSCCLCNQNKEVYGLVANASGFKFSTVDKVGNVPGFLEKNQWKLLPICSDCALYLDAGAKFVDGYLNFSEFGLQYYVIPNFLFDSSKGFNKLYKDVKLFESDENLKSIDTVEIENKLQRFINRIDDVVEFKFLFYKKSNSAFDILAYTESVIPSWLNDLYETQRQIADDGFFSEENLKLIFNEKHEDNFINFINRNEKFNICTTKNWYKKFLRDFINDFSNKMYLDMVVSIISNKKIDYDFLISRIINNIRFDWRNSNEILYDYSFKVSILKSLMLLLLVNKLNLIKGEKIMECENEEFSVYSILNSPSKKATFLLGVLTRKLMNIQYRELHSTPFYNTLWGLSLDQKKIRKLYPRVINKLREYDAGYMKDLEEQISINLAMSENDWHLNRDETSYYFALGFTLYNFDKIEEKEDDFNE